MSQADPPPGTGQERPSPGPFDPFVTPPPPYQRPPTHVNNNLVWAILATIFCCVPTGIVAIIYAAQVNGRLDRGDIAGAQRCANKAQTWAIASVVLGVSGAVIYFFVYFVVALVGEL